MRWWAELPGRVLGPMFVLDAVRAGRRTSTFLARWLFLLGLGLILFMFFTGSSRQFRGGPVPHKDLADFAENYFWVYAVAQFLIVCALTPAFTAAAITDEKERKTLDFLLVTDMSAREIVLGKLGARVGVLVTFALAGLPILSLIQFFGGVDPRLVLIAAAMTLVSIVSLAAVSVACSVALPRTREAVVLAYAIPAAYVYLSFAWWWNAAFAPAAGGPLGGPPVAPAAWLRAAELFAAGNPFVATRQLASGGPTSAFASDNVPEVAAAYAAFHGVVALAGFAFAALLLRRVARRGGAGAKPRTPAAKLFAWALGKRTEARPHPPVGDHPVYWREVWVDPGSSPGVIRRLLAVGVVCAVVFPFLSIVVNTLIWPPQYTPRWGPQQYDAWRDFQEQTKAWVCAVTGLLGGVMLLRAAVRGAGAVAGEKDRDTWTSLLATPLGTHEILVGKCYGCVFGQRDAMYLLAAVWAVGVLTMSVNPFAVALAAGALAIYLVAFAWLGIACSVTARNTRTAIARAVPLALLMAGGFWIVLGCFGVCLLAGSGRGGNEAIAHVGVFLFGFTPAIVLGGLPAVDFKMVQEMNRGGDGSLFGSMVCGGFFGTGVWLWIASALHMKAEALFEKEANREAAERLPDLSPLTRPRPAPPPGDRPGSPGSGDTS